MPVLNWVGKKKVVNHHHEVPFRLLEKKYSFSANEGNPSNSTNNRIIHGDNLEALKSLLPELEGKVKCIYIDPPYNTGNESWIYNDNVNDPKIRNWLGKLVGKEGDDLSRHDKWLCMMYPRLKLLHRLLSDDGVIFISINDIEESSLKLICDEIFGPQNFLTKFIWNSEGNTDNQLEVKVNHEYILCFLKKMQNKSRAIGKTIDPNTREDSNLWQGIADNNINKNNPSNPPSQLTLPVGFPCIEDELFYPAKAIDSFFLEKTKLDGFVSDEIKSQYNIEPLSGMPVKLDDMVVKDGKLTQPCRIYGGFANEKKLRAFIQNNLNPVLDEDGGKLEFYLNKNCAVRYRKENNKPSNILSVLRGFGTTEKTRTVLKNAAISFNYPKPVELIQYLLEVGAEPEDSIVLDSFAGSGTTGEAVLRLNQKDRGLRSFICIEMLDYAEDITSKRIQTTANGYTTKKHDKIIKGVGGGFSYYTLGLPLFKEDNTLNEEVGEEHIRDYVSYAESIPSDARHGIDNPVSKYALGASDTALWLFFYERQKVTTLDLDFLTTLNIRSLPKRPEHFIIYADKCALDKDFLHKHSITFKRIPRDITRF